MDADGVLIHVRIEGVVAISDVIDFCREIGRDQGGHAFKAKTHEAIVDRCVVFRPGVADELLGIQRAARHVEHELLRDLDKRLDKYLVDRIPFLSRTSLQHLIREKAVTVNGRVPKVSTKLHKGDVVVAVLPPPPSGEIPAEDIPLEVLYEDAELIVINKADNIIVHPARGNKSGTIINALAWHFLHKSSGALSSVGGEFARPGVVHRLDRHTTGVMVAAKTDTAQKIPPIR